MFIKSVGFKKLLKEAYKRECLRIGKQNEKIFITGGFWGIELLENEIPKKELAAIIEFAGEMPNENECILVKESMNQYGMLDALITEIREKGYGKRENIEITNNILIGADGCVQRILQNDKCTKVINEEIIRMIDKTIINVDGGETDPEGPFVTGGNTIRWQNNVMAMRVAVRWWDSEEQEERYRKFDFRKKVED